jgi:hypothetical protein
MREFINIQNKIKIKCEIDHKFNISIKNLLYGGWCKDCKMHIGEKLSNYIFEYLFDKPFITVRPIWLKTENTNRLEIDIFNEELKLCAEYNGLQHYKYVSFYHKTEAIFEELKTRDKIKKELILKKGYNFIEIPYTIKYENLCKYIYMMNV